MAVYDGPIDRPDSRPKFYRHEIKGQVRFDGETKILMTLDGHVPDGAAILREIQDDLTQVTSVEMRTLRNYRYEMEFEFHFPPSVHPGSLSVQVRSVIYSVMPTPDDVAEGTCILRIANENGVMAVEGGRYQQPCWMYIPRFTKSGIGVVSNALPKAVVEEVYAYAGRAAQASGETGVETPKEIVIDKTNYQFESETEDQIKFVKKEKPVKK